MSKSEPRQGRVKFSTKGPDGTKYCPGACQENTVRDAYGACAECGRG